MGKKYKKKGTRVSDRTMRMNDLVRNKNPPVKKRSRVAATPGKKRKSNKSPKSAEKVAEQVLKEMNCSNDQRAILDMNELSEAIISIVEPVFEENKELSDLLDDAESQLADALGLIDEMIEERAQLKKHIQNLKYAQHRHAEKQRIRVSREKHSRVWIVFKVVAGLSYRQMRFFRHCEEAVTERGVKADLFTPTEVELLTGWRHYCEITSSYVLNSSIINPEWKDMVHFVDPEPFMSYILETHAKELKGEYLNFDVNIDVMRRKETRYFMGAFGVDGAKMTRKQTYTIGSYFLDIYDEEKLCLNYRFRLGMMSRYGENHPATIGVLNYISDKWETLRSRPIQIWIKATNRAGMNLKNSHLALIGDWAFKSKVRQCLPAAATVCTEFENICMDNISALRGKRGDDESLGLLTLERREELGKIAETHYEQVRREAVETEQFDEEQLEKRMAEERLNYSTNGGDGPPYNPQIKPPLPMSKHMITGVLHGGLRQVPRDLLVLNQLCKTMYDNGLVDNTDVVALALEQVDSKALSSAIDSLRDKKKKKDEVNGTGNMIGRMVDVIQRNWGVIYGMVKRAAGENRGFKLVISARFYISAQHRNILGILKLQRPLLDEHIESIITWGSRAFNVWYAFFGSTKPSPYQIALEFEIGPVIKNYIAETGYRNIYNLSEQNTEHSNLQQKKSLHTFNNWCTNPRLIGLTRNKKDPFPDEWRLGTFQVFVCDNIKKLAVIQLDLHTAGELAGTTDRKSRERLRILPTNDQCQLCGERTSSGSGSATGKCGSDMCESLYMDIILAAAESGEISQQGKGMLLEVAKTVETSSSSSSSSSALAPNAEVESRKRKVPVLASAATRRKQNNSKKPRAQSLFM